jgi:hypothetical protein
MKDKVTKMTISMDEALDGTFSIKMSTKHIQIIMIGNVDVGMSSTSIRTLKSSFLYNGRG